MNSPDKALPDPNQEPSAGQTSIEFEAVSLRLDSLLSQGDSPDINELLKQIERMPKEQRRFLLAKFSSLSKVATDSSEKQSSHDSKLDRSRVARRLLSDSLIDSAATRDTDAEPATAEFSRPGQRLGNYTLISELGKGGMGVVYRARHHERGEVVALKVLPNVDGASLHRFKREFRSLADISHPNLVGLRTLEESGGNWFFTMDLVEHARTFRSFVRPSGQLDESRLRRSLAQLVEGVHTLHVHEVIHRDLKPSNVLVDPNGRVVIMDFGLVRELSRHDQTVTAQDISGTPAYMAPESVGGGQDTFACDWYAVGVMLYEALSGKLPFSGDTLQILSDKRSQDAPPLTESESIPEDLRQICMRLLEREPTRRSTYQELSVSLGKAPSAAESLDEHEEKLLGRAWQLSSLRNHYDKVQATERPLVTLVSGKSGEGKSALIEKFLNELRKTENVTILAGRCYDRESVPFKALDSLIDALASFLRTMDTADSAVLLPDDTGFLASVFPVLGRVEVVAKRPAPAIKGLDDQQVRKRAFAALRELLRRICLRYRVVLFSDDLQWGDADSAEVLNDVLSGADAPQLLFIGSFRSDEADTSPFLKSWNRYQQPSSQTDLVECANVTVGPLTLEHCAQLIAGRLKISESACRSLADELLRETSGNAFFLSELLDCLDPTSQQLRRIPLREVIAQKLTKLPSEASELLTMIAVSGQSIGISELLEASGCSSSGYAAITHMRNVRLIRLIGDESTQIVDTYHDKIRETVLATLDASSSRSAHGRLARVIENNASDIQPDITSRILAGEDIEQPNLARVYDLAVHYDASGDTEKAATYALLAAEQARRQFSPEVATRQYEIAIRNNKNSLLNGCAFRVYSGYASSSLMIGKYAEVETATDELLRVAKAGIEMANYHELRGEVAFRRQKYTESLQYFSAALRELGVRVPSTTLGLLMETSKLLSVHLVRSALGLSGGKAALSLEQRAMLRVHARMTPVAGFTDGTVLGWTVLRGLNIGEKFIPTRDVGMLYSAYCLLAGALGLQKRAMKYGNRGLQIQRELNDDFGVAHAASWSGIMGVATGEYARAEAVLREAVERFGKVGEVWELNMAQLHLGCVMMMQGRLDEALVEGHQAFVRAAKFGDTRTNCTLYLLARASQGRLPMETYAPHVIHAEEDILSTCNLHKAHGIMGLQREHFEQSVDYFEQSCARPLEKKVPNFHAIAGLPFLVQSLRQQYGANPQDRKPLVRAWRLARRGHWLCRFFPNEYPFALREHGEVAWLLGKKKLALRSFDRSIAVAAKQGAKCDLALTQLPRAILRKEMNLDSGDLEIQAAKAEIQRFSDLIDVGLKKIAALKF